LYGISTFAILEPFSPVLSVLIGEVSMVRKRKKLSSRNQKSDLPGQENTSCGATLLDSLTIRSIILRLRKCSHKYADPCNGGSCRRLYILSRRDKISRCPRKSIHARTPCRIPPPRLSARVLFARYSSFSSVYTIVALGELFVNRFALFLQNQLKRKSNDSFAFSHLTGY